jgi:hypothetical protein
MKIKCPKCNFINDSKDCIQFGEEEFYAEEGDSQTSVNFVCHKCNHIEFLITHSVYVGSSDDDDDNDEDDDS